MSYEAMPCVLKNEDGTPMYGLLIKPLQSQFVIQLAPNSCNGGDNQQRQEQSQHQQQQVNPQTGVPTISQHSAAGSALQFVAFPPQAPTTSNWNTTVKNANAVAGTSGGAGAGHRRHYPTILPRETTPSTGKPQQIASWTSATGGNYAPFNGAAVNNYVTSFPPCSKTSNSNALKSSYSGAAPSVATPVNVPFMNTNDQHFAQAFSSDVISQPVVSTSTGVNCRLVDQQFAIVLGQNCGGGDDTLGDGTGVPLPCDGGSANSVKQSSAVSVVNNNSSDLDSLLRDIDLNEITNSLMPLLQDCSAENGEIIAEGACADPSSSGINEKTYGACIAAVNNSTDGGNVEQSSSSSSQHGTMETARPPCRYQGLLSNTNNLRVGRANANTNTNAPMFSIFDSGYPSGDQSSSVATGCVSSALDAGANRTVQAVQAVVHGHADVDRPTHESTSPDSGIQSIGDSPRAVPQSSPVQFFSSSPGGRPRRFSSPRRASAASTSTTIPTTAPVAYTCPSHDPSTIRQDGTNHFTGNGTSASTTTWTSKYMQPLCVNTGFYEPVSESDSSPSVQPIAENSTGLSKFASLEVPRCYSPSNTSSDCGSSQPSGTSVAKRRRRTRKRTTGQAATAVQGNCEFEDMPVLHPEANEENKANSRKSSHVESETGVGCATSSQETSRLPVDNGQLVLDADDANALVEKILSIVPKDKLASLRQILDERLQDERSGSGSKSGTGVTTAISNGRRNMEARIQSASSPEFAVPRWQSTNAGYSSDTSDVSTFTETGLPVSSKRMADEEIDSATSTSALRRSSASSCTTSADGKKQDALKKLLEYRAKARSKCVKSSLNNRVEQLVSVMDRLVLLKEGETEQPTRASMATAFRKVQEKLTMLKDAPKLVREEMEIKNDDKRRTKVAVENLEAEASDEEEGGEDEEDDDIACLSPCPQLTAEHTEEQSEKQADVVERNNSHETSHADRTDEKVVMECLNSTHTLVPLVEKVDETTVRSEGEAREIVQVNEHPQRKNISVKIKLSILRSSSTEGDSYAVAGTKQTQGKTKRQKTQPALPPKKRFKGKESGAEMGVEEETRQKRPNREREAASKKRSNSKANLIRQGTSKKRKVVFKSMDELEKESADVPSEGNGEDAVRLGVFRRCGGCKTWLRVSEEKEEGRRRTGCTVCQVNDGKKEEAQKSVAVGKEGRGKTGDGDVANSHSVRSPGKKVSPFVWKYPRKTYAKAGILCRGSGSSETVSFTSTLGVNQCRLLGEVAEVRDFDLPYDVWWHHRHQKNFMCVNPSENYRKLRSNVYIDVKPPTGVQHPVCSCEVPSDGTNGGCGEDCLNRLMYTECSQGSCPCGDRCTNNRFQRRDWATSLEIFDCKNEKGMGIRTKVPLKAGTFLCEYVGEVVSTKTFGERMGTWYKECKHHYALTLDAGAIIDSYRSGSMARFINHSCQPNCEMQKWCVNGHCKMGVFVVRDMKAGEELTYDYKFHAFSVPQSCLCASSSCRGFVDGSSASHQGRKSKPKRSNAKQVTSPNNLAKFNLLKPFSHRERVLIIKRRLLLLRNVESVRKKLQAMNNLTVENGIGTEDEKRKTDLILSQLRALKASRRLHIRQSAVTAVPPPNSISISNFMERSDIPNATDASGKDEFSEVYWGANVPFRAETAESTAPELWREKGDAFDKQDDKVHCVCGIFEDDGMMIQCDRCRYWQHSECVGVDGEQTMDEYACDLCTSGNLTLRRDVLMNPQPEMRLPHCVYYRALLKKDLQVRIGECVYVKKSIDERHKQLLRNFNRQCVQGESSTMDCSESVVDGDSIGDIVDVDDDQRRVYMRSDLRVFRVERLFIGPRGVRFVFGSYFARPHETFCEPSRRFYRNEIFVTPLYDTLPLDAVVGRCLVLDVQTYCKGRPKYPKYAEEDIYICEYRLDKGQRLFDKMHVRNRYPVCTRPYIFKRLLEKMKIKRDFTPFIQTRKPESNNQSSKANSSNAKSKKKAATQSSISASSSKSRSGSGRNVLSVEQGQVRNGNKKNRIEAIVKQLKSE